MYHSPVPMESDAPESDLRPEVAESVALDLGSERLRDAHLHNGQVEARALFAPFFAITAVAAALITAWAMYGSVELEARRRLDRAGRLRQLGLLPPRARGRGLGQQPHRQAARALVRGRRGGRPGRPVVGAADLRLRHPAARRPGRDRRRDGGDDRRRDRARRDPRRRGRLDRDPDRRPSASLIISAAPRSIPKIALTFVMVAGAGAFGLARLTRWIFGQLKVLARTRAQAESIRLLLNEYEHRGVGWLWQVDAENRVVYISSRMTALLGRSTNQMIGHSLPASLGGTSALGRILLSRQPFANLEMELKTRRGTRWISLSGDPIIDMTGAFQGFRGVGQDVTDVRRTQERLTNLANMDVLSGLPNRGRVRQLLGEALSGSAGGEAPCAIMFLDLDGFKPVNDTFGHPKGDVVLKSVAQRLLKEAGPFGQVGRMGGDEFAIVIKDANSRRMVETLADRLIAAIAEPFHIDKAEIRIGVSIGCAFGPVDGQSVDDLIQKADLALYQAKALGRGTCCFFNADMQNEAEDRLRLEQDMRIGIKSKQFRLAVPAADQRRRPEPR